MYNVIRIDITVIYKYLLYSHFLKKEEIKIGVDEKLRFSIRQADSYDRMLTIVIGARTWGKTYQWKKKALKHFINNDKQSVYFRRFETELKECKKNLFDDTNEDFLKNDDFVSTDISNIWYNKSETIINKNGDIKEKNKKTRMGYMLHMAKGQNIKSSSYRRVESLLFDEFLIEDKIHHYYPAEPETFMGIVNTINRDRSGKDKVKIYLFANAVTQYNPYFKFWGIKGLNDNQKWYLDFNKQITVYYDRNEEFEKSVMNTEFGELIKGTAVERYQIRNQFLLDLDNDFICKKPYYSKYTFTLIYNNKFYGVYYSHSEGRFWISESYDKNYRWIFAATGKDLRPNIQLLKENTFFKHIKMAYRNGYLYYENLGVCKELEKMLEILNII